MKGLPRAYRFTQLHSMNVEISLMENDGQGKRSDSPLEDSPELMYPEDEVDKGEDVWTTFSFAVVSFTGKVIGMSGSELEGRIKILTGVTCHGICLV